MVYSSALSSLNTLQPLGIRPGLSRIKALLKALGHPERGVQAIHVAGSNGKGSVCRMLESVLIASGYGVGMFISPHLTDFRERFRIQGRMAAEADVARAYPALARALKQPAVLRHGPPTFFEAVTALAFLIFRAQGCKVLVLETGLGGRYDSTNVIPKPLLTLITNISLEHTQILGSTESQIAWEKAGILKRGVPLVTAARGKALDVIKRELKKVKGSTLRVAAHALPGRQQMEPRVGQQVGPYFIPLLGPYQRLNLACALEGVRLLRRQGLRLPEDALKAGLARADWPGRMQILSKKPLVLLDGAHNPAGARALAQALRSLKPKRVLMAAGVLKDKDWKSMFSTFAGCAQRLYLARPQDPRGLDPAAILDWSGWKAPRARSYVTPTAALAAAKRDARPGDLVVAAGSLYTVGELLPKTGRT